MEEDDEWTVAPIPTRPAPAAQSDAHVRWGRRGGDADRGDDDGWAVAPIPGPARSGGTVAARPTLEGLAAPRERGDAGRTERAPMPPSPDVPARRPPIGRADGRATMRPAMPEPPSPMPDLESVSDSPAETSGVRWRRTTAVAAMLLTAAMLAGGGLLSVRHSQERRAAAAAYARCESSLERLSSARSALSSAVADAERELEDSPASSLKDPETRVRLERLVKPTVRKGTAECTASATAEESAATATKTDGLARTMASRTRDLRKAMNKVRSSKLDKTVDEAGKLLVDSDGKVQDEKTRDELSKAIEARDGTRIAKAVKAVNDSVTARRKADEEAAKRKSDEENEAAAQTEQSAQSAPSTAASGPSASDRTGRRQSSQDPSPSSAPSWNVPSESDADGLPDTDPGL